MSGLHFRFPASERRSSMLHRNYPSRCERPLLELVSPGSRRLPLPAMVARVRWVHAVPVHEGEMRSCCVKNLDCQKPAGVVSVHLQPTGPCQNCRNANSHEEQEFPTKRSKSGAERTFSPARPARRAP